MRQLLSTCIVSLTVAIGLSVPASAVAGPWVSPPGEGYVKMSGTYFDATGVYDRSGESVDANYDYSHAAFRLYTDVGIAPHVSMSASVPFLRSQNAEVDSPTTYIKSGPGDLDLAAQVGGTYEKLAISGVAEVRVPLYSETISAEAPTPSAFTGEELDQRRFMPALGDGSFDVTTLLQVGYSLYPFPGWVTASIGPKFRFQGFGNGIEYAASAGAFVWPDRVALTLRADGIRRLSEGNTRPTKSYTQFSGGTILRLAGGFSLETTASYIPTGAFVSRGWSVSGGISYDGELFPNPWEK